MGPLIATALLALFIYPLAGTTRSIRLAPVLLILALVWVVRARPWTWPATRWQAADAWRPSTRTVAVASCVTGAVLFWLVLARFRAGEINAIDFTVYYDRPNLQTLLGHPLFVESADDPVRAYRSYFAVHAHWIMLPLALLYALHPSPLWTLALSAVAVTAGALYVFRIVRDTCGGFLLAAAGACAFVANDSTARTLYYGFHAEVLYAWFIPWMIDSGLRRRWWQYAVAALACVLVKEDAFLPVAAAALTIAIVSRRTLTRFEGLVLLPLPTVLALANLAVYYTLVVPRFSATGIPFYANYWSDFGPTAVTAFIGMLRHPLQVLEMTVSSSFFTRVLPGFLFLPLAGWSWLVGAAPVVVLYGSSSNAQLRSLGIYYGIVLVPFLTLAAVDGARRLADILWSDRGKARVIGAAAVVVASLIGGPGHSVTPWKREISEVPRMIAALNGERVILVQSGLYPHAGYQPKVQLLTEEALADPANAGAAVVFAPGISSYPLTPADLERFVQPLPVVGRNGGVTAARLR